MSEFEKMLSDGMKSPEFSKSFWDTMSVLGDRILFTIHKPDGKGYYDSHNDWSQDSVDASENPVTLYTKPTACLGGDWKEFLVEVRAKESDIIEEQNTKVIVKGIVTVERRLGFHEAVGPNHDDVRSLINAAASMTSEQREEAIRADWSWTKSWPESWVQASRATDSSGRNGAREIARSAAWQFNDYPVGSLLTEAVSAVVVADLISEKALADLTYPFKHVWSMR